MCCRITHTHTHTHTDKHNDYRMPWGSTHRGIITCTQSIQCTVVVVKHACVYQCVCSWMCTPGPSCVRVLSLPESTGGCERVCVCVCGVAVHMLYQAQGSKQGCEAQSTKPGLSIGSGNLVYLGAQQLTNGSIHMDFGDCMVQARV